jgi:hypothetical protein
MTVLAEPQQAGEVADVGIARVELARLVAAHELLDGKARTALDLMLEERAILALIEHDDGGSGFCVIFGHGIGTAVVLFPIVKRQSEAIALGYVATRVLESTIIVVGLISLLSVVTLREDLAGAAGADAAALTTAGQSLVAIHDWTFLFGPAFCAARGSGMACCSAT